MITIVLSAPVDGLCRRRGAEVGANRVGGSEQHDVERFLAAWWRPKRRFAVAASLDEWP